ncbi:MAG: hypothetical protein JEY91_02190 [Spirochaetaceae bacterium]|nr:hypothetical protein [Spirochaetaceae bacterium]
MLAEVKNVRQIPEEGLRRWFMDNDMDLILWYDSDENKMIGFQISYDKRSVQRTVTWKSSDEGRTGSTLTCDGPYNKKRIVRLLEQKGGELDEEILQFILLQLKVQDQ